MKFIRTAVSALLLAVPVLACPRCKEGLAGSELDGWFLSIVGMVLAPFVIGGAAAAYIARYGRKVGGG